MSYNLDKYFIQHPHEYDPKRLYSQNNADWQYRVDHDRMRKERLARLQGQLKARDIGLPWMGNNNIRPAMTWQWAEGAVPHMVHKMVGGIVDVLKENGIAKER